MSRSQFVTKSSNAISETELDLIHQRLSSLLSARSRALLEGNIAYAQAMSASIVRFYIQLGCNAPLYPDSIIYQGETRYLTGFDREKNPVYSSTDSKSIWVLEGYNFDAHNAFEQRGVSDYERLFNEHMVNVRDGGFGHTDELTGSVLYNQTHTSRAMD